METPIPMGEMINRYAKTTARVRFRSAMDLEDDGNIIATLKANTFVYGLREQEIDGVRWLTAIHNNRIGYISSEYVEILSQEDSDEVMADPRHTPIPPMSVEELEERLAPTPTPVPTDTPEPKTVETPIPQGEMINRFGKTTGSVRFRTAPDKENSRVIKNLSNGTVVYMIREELNDSGESWTRVYYGGREGFVSSAYLKVMSQDDSDRYMAKNYSGKKNTPVPFLSEEDLDGKKEENPTPTETETDTPSPSPTETEEITDSPSPTPTDSPTPSPTVSATPTLEPTNTPSPSPTNSPTPEVTDSPTPAVTDSPTPDVTDSPTPEVTDSPTPAVTDSPTPVVTESPTPVVTDSPTPAFTQEPPQITGYAITIGDGAYVRNWPSSTSVIVDELLPNKVVFVNAQKYIEGVAWHQIQYGNTVGYVRADMLRMMGESEVISYLDAINATPEPTAEITVQPYDPNSMSSYGYTTTTVNFRENASRSSGKIRQLKQYAFCLVLGVVEVDGATWYRVTYDGKTGYIMGDYFKQMTLSELESFLGSQNYLKGIADNSATSSDTSSTSVSGGSTTVISAEDQKVRTWTNPESGITVSYEPFDPFATPAPLATEEPHEYLDSLVGQIQSGVMTQEQAENLLKNHYQGAADRDKLVADGLAYIQANAGLVLQATDTPEPSPEGSIAPTNEPPTENTEGGVSTGWIIGGLALVAAAGGGYLWYSSQQRKRKAAQAAARKRAAQARQRQQEGAPSGTRAASSSAGSSAAADQSAYRRPANQPRTGTYTEQNGRPSARPSETSASGQNTQRPRPYSGSMENPYGRYSSRTEEDASYTASFRPEENRTGGSSRRRSRAERHNTNAEDDNF